MQGQPNTNSGDGKYNAMLPAKAKHARTWKLPPGWGGGGKASNSKEGLEVSRYSVVVATVTVQDQLERGEREHGPLRP